MGTHPLLRLFSWLMRSSHLGKALGVPIEISHLMIIIPLLFIGDLPLTLLVAAVYFCILLHELGHASIVQWFDFQVDKIVLSPLGGVAKITDNQAILHFAQKPKKEMLMAFAGPWVNLMLALVFYLLNFAFESWFFRGLTYINLLLGLFNLIPAFPMDGGRIFRAILCYKGNSYYQATQKTLLVGKYILLGLVIISLIEGQFFIVFLAILLYFMGQTELIRALQIESQLNTENWHSPFQQEGLGPEQIFIHRNLF